MKKILVLGVSGMAGHMIYTVLGETKNYEIVGTYPHNPDYFTQGFYFKNGDIYEGTGLREGKTRLIKYKLGATEPTKLYQIKSKKKHLFTFVKK